MVASAVERVSLLPQDPLTIPLSRRTGDKTYTVNLRIISHGAELKPELRARLIRATEYIFSQCEGVDFRVKVVAEARGRQEKYASYQAGDLNGRFSLRENFVKFFEPWRASRQERTIDVHVVKKFKQAGTSFGVGFGVATIDETFVTDWPSNLSRLRPSEISGNSLIIAAETIEKRELEITKGLRPGSAPLDRDIDRAWKSLQSALLAHELGHILIEDRTNTNHRCANESDGYCTRENLMSEGGPTYEVHLKIPGFREILGYTPLPRVNDYQCQVLRSQAILDVTP